MKQHWWQLLSFCVPVILSLWLLVACAQAVATSDPALVVTPPLAQSEIGVDIGTIRAVAYSGEGGDAYVRIEGNTVYAEARLNGSVLASMPTMTAERPTATPTPIMVTTPIAEPTDMPTKAVVMISANSSANVRAAPWGALLGTVGPGESFTANGIAQPWYRMIWHGQEVWIHGDLVTVTGDIASLPVVAISVTQPATAAPTATQPPPDPPITSALSYQFLASVPLLQAEANNPAFYLQIEQNQNPAPGRWCVVFHNGTEVGRAQ